MVAECIGPTLVKEQAHRPELVVRVRHRIAPGRDPHRHSADEAHAAALVDVGVIVVRPVVVRAQHGLVVIK